MVSPKLIIRTTPRSGSNLLCHSLAQHPDVRYAGEYYTEDTNRVYEDYLENKLSGNWNLTKIFYLEPIPIKLFSGINVSSNTTIPHKDPSAYSFVSIFLYRENIEAQALSYVRACTSGEWINGCFNEPEIPLDDFVERVKTSNTELINLCRYHISYEELISNWDDVISKILDIMQWKPMKIPQALQKQSVNTKT